ncbi:hypothetical protein AGDE_12737 [Angomonas deanei]|nr:hypothetical protein AGDE_12737 [Angomonas deanei]|eukprot:EPY23608.1 hypothetical protein AGDE_12737 [Angomonas deanei]
MTSIASSSSLLFSLVWREDSFPLVSPQTKKPARRHSVKCNTRRRQCGPSLLKRVHNERSRVPASCSSFLNDSCKSTSKLSTDSEVCFAEVASSFSTVKGNRTRHLLSAAACRPNCMKFSLVSTKEVSTTNICLNSFRKSLSVEISVCI